jgi:DNA polymerase-3 subunit epsilon
MSDLAALIEVVNRNEFVVLDTETTGLGRDAEIVQLALLSCDGHPILDTLIRPKQIIPYEATSIHGITNEMVKDAPDLRELMDCLFKTVEGRDVIIYNASFDIPMLRQTFAAHGFNPAWQPFYDSIRSITCAMLGYAEHNGDWNDYFGNYRWVRLAHACANERLSVADAHQAMGDCKMTLALIKHLASYLTPDEA